MQVKDKRRVTPDEQKATEEAVPVEAEVVEALEEPEEQQPDYLGDLQRLQAEFSNYRKRMMRETAEASARGAERVVVQVLPVLDNFERAIAHGEGGEGVELVFKELKAVLETTGLEEVPGEGAPFDPQVHEAVESSEDESVTEEVVRAVHRRGYTMNGKLLRAAMVGVARPLPPVESEPEPEAGDQEPEE
ncbi:MAG TPA: nucleotide exchange factor GrpE [Actinomycetota bacterium]|nr:nucleotide exchange factor GrpE [Actinomycetota bacterium]